jgi:hypothetical protein
MHALTQRMDFHSIMETLAPPWSGIFLHFIGILAWRMSYMDDVAMRLFVHTFEGRVKAWFDDPLERSISTWDKLETVFRKRLDEQ